jgi:hypothetical protein
MLSSVIDCDDEKCRVLKQNFVLGQSLRRFGDRPWSLSLTCTGVIRLDILKNKTSGRHPCLHEGSFKTEDMRVGRTSPFPQTDSIVSCAVTRVMISLHYPGTEEAICDVETDSTSIGLLSTSPQARVTPYNAMRGEG